MQVKLKQKIDGILGSFLVGIHLIPVRLVGIIFRINHSLSVPPQNIIFIKMLGFGSLLLASDAILGLKKKYPNAKLTLICGTQMHQGAAILGLFHHIKVIDDKNIFSLLKSSLQTIIYCIKLRQKWCFDLEVHSRLTTIFSLYTLSRNRFGFEYEKVHFRNYLNTHNTYFNLFIPTEENYNTMAKNALALIDERYWLPIHAKSSNKDVILINNTCSDLSIQRKLDFSQLIELVNYLLDTTSFKIALAGAPVDKADNEKVLTHIQNQRIENWAGKYSFESYLIEIKKRVSTMITIDSAPLHIAARLQVPLVAIWGPTQPKSLAPEWLRKSNLYVEVNHKVHCSPCVHHTKELPCKGNNFCIKNISISEIISAYQKLESCLSVENK